MNYQVSDAEKAQAERALLAFNYTKKLLKVASDHLLIMLTPFKDHPDINEEQVLKYRAALRRFRDKSIQNFNEFKIAAFKCITLMQMFTSDTQTIKIMKSFISAIEDIEKRVNIFSDLFVKMESKSFVADIVKEIENIQKECNDLEEVIDERIRGHLQSNIIGKNWLDNVGDELQMKIERAKPLMLDLYNEKQNELNEFNKNK